MALKSLKPVEKKKPIAKATTTSSAKKTTAKKSPAKNNTATKKSVSVQKPAIVKTEPTVKAADKKVETTPLPKQAKPVARRNPISNAVNSGKFNPVYNRADMFYKNTLKATIEKRYLPNNKEDLAFVEKGIDLSIKHNDRQKTIIEKSRDQDWNELYIEMFKNHPDTKGWVYTSEAEFLSYFFPGRVLWTKLEPIKAFCESIYNKAIDSGIFKDLRYQYQNNSGRLSKAIKINTKTYSLNFYQIYSEINGEPVYNVGIIMPFVLLMDFHIDYKIFKQ